MSVDDLPSTYELSRIAAAISGGKAASNPKHAAEKALALWFAATEEIQKEVERREENRVRESKEREMTSLLTDTHVIQLSDAVVWLNKLYRRNVIKTDEKFKDEWRRLGYCELAPRGPSRTKTTIGHLKEFWRKRENERRAKEAARKRESRQPKGAGNAVKTNRLGTTRKSQGQTCE